MKGEPRPPDIKCPDELLCLNYWGKGHRISSLLRPSRNDKHGNKVSTVTGICKQCKIEAKAEYARLKKHGDVDPEHMKLLRMYGPKIAAQKMEQKQRTVEKSRSPTQKEKETQWEQDLANYRDVKDHVSTSQAARAKDAKFGMGPRSGPNQVDFKNGGMASHIMDEAMPGHKEKRLENERRVKEYQEVQAKKQEAKAEKEAAEKAAALVKKNREMIARGLKEERLKEERMVKKRKAEEEDSQDAPKKKAKAVAKNGEVQAVPPQKQQVPRVYDGTARKPQMKARSTSHRSQHAASSGATQYSRSQVAAPGAVSNFPRIDKQSSPSADECESRGGGKFKPGYDPRRLVLKAPSTKKKAEIPKKPKSSPEPEPIQRQKKRAISDVLDEGNTPILSHSSPSQIILSYPIPTR